MTPEEKLLEGIETVIKCCNEQVAESEKKGEFDASHYLIGLKLESLISEYKIGKQSNN